MTLLTLALVEERAIPVLVPIAVVTTALVLLLLALGREPTGSPAFFEIGFIYASVVALYAVYPLLGFVANGLGYSELNDVRLFEGDPSPREMGRLGWMYAVHLVSFGATYLVFRRKVRTEGPRPRDLGRLEALLLLLLVVSVELFFAILGRLYEWSFVSNVDRYVAFANLPRLTAQFAGHLDGIRLTAEIALLCFLFQRYAKYRFWIVVWITVLAARTIVQRQSRTELVLLFFAALIMFHRLVRPLRFRWLALLSGSALAGFLILGVLRIGATDREGVSRVRALFVANEFETLMANAYDLDGRVRSRTLDPLPRGFFASDLLAIVPQQLLSLEKVSPANWYVRTMYPREAEAGIGFCFGTVSEAIVGGGWPALAARGALLGLLLGLFQRVAARRQRSFWWFLFTVWMSVLIYNSFRMTTFSFLALIWYRFLPVVAGVSAVAWLARSVIGRRPRGRALAPQEWN